MISVIDLSLSFQGQKLFDDVNLSFTPGNCYGVIGANGAGKSTFLKILEGRLEPDTGSVSIKPNTRMSFLEQDHFKFEDEKVIDVVIMGNARLMEIIREKEAIYAKEDFSDEDGILASELEAEFADMDGWSAEANASALLQGLGIGTELHEKKMSELSGKEKVKVLLAKALFGNPEILILDEPTNDLDIKSILWLENFLMDYEGTVIMVSHSRDEIYRFSEELLIMDQGKPVIYGETKEIFAKPVYKEAAKLTGCKNFSRIKRVDVHTAEILDWGITLHTNQEIDEQATWFGYRAHDFVPVWGKRKENCLKINVESEAALPFERNYYLYPEGEENQNKQTICWFLQREKLEKIGEKGMPDYLELTEDGMMFLRG